MNTNMHAERDYEQAMRTPNVSTPPCTPSFAYSETSSLDQKNSRTIASLQQHYVPDVACTRVVLDKVLLFRAIEREIAPFQQPAKCLYLE